MKRWLFKGVLAAAIALPALSGTQIPAFAQSAQEQRGQEHQGDQRPLGREDNGCSVRHRQDHTYRSRHDHVH